MKSDSLSLDPFLHANKQIILANTVGVVLLELVAWCPDPRLIGCGHSLCSQFLVNVNGRIQVHIWK